MANLTVQLSSVRKTFGATVALDNCNLNAYEGEVHAIIGGNGSGKSTLAKILSGVLIPDVGQALVLGEVIRTPVEARRLGICNVFQEVLVAEGCSVLDNLYLGSYGLFTSAAHREEKIERASWFMRELIGFDLDLSTKVGDLPLSLKQWITIARGMLAEPRVLILDESSAALDFESTERLFTKLRELKSLGTSILIITHRIAELVRIADRATVLREGSDVGCLAREEITEERLLELIAGPHPDHGAVPQPITDGETQRPLLRIEDGRVWHDAGTIDFNLYPGEIVGITGLDGQGQSDFVRAVAGVAPMVSGRISVVDENTTSEIADLRSARDNRISYVSGDRKKEGLFPNLNVFENLVMPIYHEHRSGGILSIVSTSRLIPVFEWESSKLRVKMGSRDQLITSLSGGNQQKVLIARAFAENPKILVLNDPARGIDIGAKRDLYRNLQDFVVNDRSVIFLSSEIEEFIDLCTRVHVFRNGVISASFAPPFDANVILNATFGQKAKAPESAGTDEKPMRMQGQRGPSQIEFENGRPMPRPVADSIPEIAPTRHNKGDDTMATQGSDFILSCPDIAPGQTVPDRFVEDSNVSPRLVWSGAPDGTRSFALAITDPDLPEEFGFPRCFAHWLVYDIPANVSELAEGASRSNRMPAGARELNSDFVTFNVPGFGRGYGGPWPPDREHRYFYTLYALMKDELDIDPDADLSRYYEAVMPVTIDSASFVAVYGPATKPLPS